MHKHEDKICGNCGIAFECKVGNITQCQCYEVCLSNEEQQYISKQFTGCICINCIKALRTEYNTITFVTQIKKTFGH